MPGRSRLGMGTRRLRSPGRSIHHRRSARRLVQAVSRWLRMPTILRMLPQTPSRGLRLALGRSMAQHAAPPAPPPWPPPHRMLEALPAHAQLAAMPNWRGLSLVFICALLGRGAVGEDLLVLQRCGGGPLRGAQMWVARRSEVLGGAHPSFCLPLAPNAAPPPVAAASPLQAVAAHCVQRGRQLRTRLQVSSIGAGSTVYI